MSPLPPESVRVLSQPSPQSSRLEYSIPSKMSEPVKVEAQVEPPKLATLIKETDMSYGNKEFCKFIIVDCRRFLDYNTSHIRSAINVCCSKLVRRRLQENKMSAIDLLVQQLTSCGLITSTAEVPHVDVVLYDQQSMDPLVMTERVKSCPASLLTPAKPIVSQQPLKAKRQCPVKKMRSATGAAQMDDSTFLSVLMDKLCTSAEFSSVKILKGGFLDFQARYPELCEGAVPAAGGMLATPGRGAPAKLSLTSLSQPCLPVSSSGPTRILPFLYLGSQQDAMDPETLKKFGIDYVINLSSNCPRPPFLCESKFLRISVNDSYTEKLLPHFEKAFEFMDKVREANACVLVHCLAGISRSPTVAIAYIMRHLHMSSEDAYRYIKEKRPSISPNFNFLGQLLEYEKRLKEFREKNIHEQLKGSLRKVLVPPTPGPKTSPPHLPNLAAEAPVFCSPPNTARGGIAHEINLIKRSISCPMKIHKTGKDSSVDASGTSEISESPSSEVNINGKRKMEKRDIVSPREPTEDVEMAEAVAETLGPIQPTIWPLSTAFPIQSPGAERPRGLGGFAGFRTRKGLHIPNPVQEDLPSPSTELSKLTFTAASASLTPPAPPTAVIAATAIQEEEEEEGDCVGGGNCSEPPLSVAPLKSGESVQAGSEQLRSDKGEEQRKSCGRETEKEESQPGIFPHCADTDSACAKPSPEVQRGGGGAACCHTASNPFFANLPKLCDPSGTERQEASDRDGSRVSQQQIISSINIHEEKIIDEETVERTDRATTTPLPLVTVSAQTPQKSRWRAVSEPVVPDTGSLSVENPLFPSRKPKKFRFGAPGRGGERKSASPNPSRKDSTGKQPTSSAQQAPVSGISQRISHFLRRAQAVPITSAGMGAESTAFSFFSFGLSKSAASTSSSTVGSGDSGVVRSATSGGISTQQVPTPPKSKSESGCLYSMSDDLESPESGFVESPMTDISGGHPYGCDPERESISSASSLEIAVN